MDAWLHFLLAKVRNLSGRLWRSVYGPPSRRSAAPVLRAALHHLAVKLLMLSLERLVVLR
jgi:hypothetical protein